MLRAELEILNSIDYRNKRILLLGTQNRDVNIYLFKNEIQEVTERFYSQKQAVIYKLPNGYEVVRKLLN